MLLIMIIKTFITLQHYPVRCVLSSLCFGTALGEVFTVFGGLGCTIDVGTLTQCALINDRAHKSSKKCAE